MPDKVTSTKTMARKKPPEAEILFSLSNELLAIADFDGYFKRLNPAWEKVLGYTLEELYAKPAIEFVHPDDRAATLARKGSLIEGNDVINFENRYLAKDGSEHWLLWSACLSKEDQLIYAAARDITERKQTEVELVYTRQTLENAVEGIAKVDLSGRFTAVNLRYAEHLGYKPEELLGAHWHISVHPDDLIALQKAYDKMLLEGKSEIEARGIKRDGNLSYSQIVLVKAWDHKQHFIGHHCFMKDITARKQAEAKIKELNEDLAQRLSVLAAVNQELEILTHKLELAYDEALEASKLKSEFVANISHEVRTPISAVIGITELLQDTVLTPEQHQFVNIIFDSAQSLLTIINDILDFSKMEAGRIELESIDFDLLAIVKGCINWFESEATNKKLSLRTEIDAAVPQFVRGDPVRLRQILVNLTSNAIKFTSAGTITLKLTIADRRAGDLIVRFEVSDTGIGISEAARKFLFQPFAQADGSTTRKYGGTGLGLSISKRLVELMGGQIDVESKEEVGSKFWFTVPLRVAQTNEHSAEDYPQLNTALLVKTQLATPSSLTDKVALAQAIATVPQARDSAQQAIGEQRWVLLAEDNPVLQELASRQLEKLGFNVKVVSNGHEALQAVSEKPYAAIFMDCQMPAMDGFEATAAIRQNESGTNKHVPIVALTASAMPADRKRCLGAGMDDHLSKPVRLKQLVKVVMKWLPTNKEVEGYQSFFASEATEPTIPEDKASTLIDLNNLRELYGEDSLAEILSMFLDEAKNLISRLTEGLKKRNCSEFIADAHQLKGVSAAVLATDLNQYSLNLEKAAKAGSWEESEHWHNLLVKEFKQITKFVEKALNNQSNS